MNSLPCLRQNVKFKVKRFSLDIHIQSTETFDSLSSDSDYMLTLEKENELKTKAKTDFTNHR